MTPKEALENLKDEIIPDYALEYEEDEGYKNWVNELYLTIKQDLERKEKLEKVIEILKEKFVFNIDSKQWILTKQEYELLKEVLE